MHLSLSTVSLVINNKANVNEETRQKVLRIIDEMGFHPRRSARGLASQLSGNIGFILHRALKTIAAELAKTGVVP